MNMEVSGLLVGDLIKVNDGYSVPADVRIVRSIGLCTLDPSDITDGRTYTVNENEAGNVYQYSPNMAFAGYRCEGGDFTGVVIATGLDTLVGRMIKKGMWPPQLH
jgi:magnesium-transporting ATPase (P-type)